MALGGGSGGGNAGGVRAGRAYVELGAKDSLSGVLKRVGARFAQFGKMVLAATGVGGIVGGLLGGLSFKETVDDLSKMNDVAKAFGVTGTRISGLFGVLGAAGGEFKENLEGVIQFSGTIEKALQGVGQGAELFDGLAVSAKEIAKLPIDDQFYSVLGAIRELPQPMQQAKLALLGGSDSLKQWQRLLSMSEADMRKLAAELAFSTAELEDAAKASRAMERVGAAVMRIWQQIAIIAAPLVADIANGIADALKPIQEWLRGRTLSDLWEMAKAGFAAAVSWIDLKGKELFANLGSYFAEQFNKGVLTAKEAFADLGSHISKALMGALNGPANLLAGMLDKIDPATAMGIRAASKAGGFDAAAAKVTAGAEFAAAEKARKKAQEDQLKDVNSGLVGMAVRLMSELTRLEGNKRARLADPDAPAANKMQQAIAQLGRVAGTFGGSGSLARSLGVQSANTTLKELQKGNKLAADGNKVLEKIENKVGPPKITA